VRWIIFAGMLFVGRHEALKAYGAAVGQMKHDVALVVTCLSVVAIAALFPALLSTFELLVDAVNWARRRLKARRPVSMDPVMREEPAA
jgi:hypothetical protein